MVLMHTISYDEDDVLFDPTTDNLFKQAAIAEIVTHEVLHQV